MSEQDGRGGPQNRALVEIEGLNRIEVTVWYPDQYTVKKPTLPITAENDVRAFTTTFERSHELNQSPPEPYEYMAHVDAGNEMISVGLEASVQDCFGVSLRGMDDAPKQSIRVFGDGDVKTEIHHFGEYSVFQSQVDANTLRIEGDFDGE